MQAFLITCEIFEDLRTQLHSGALELSGLGDKSPIACIVATLRWPFAFGRNGGAGAGLPATVAVMHVPRDLREFGGTQFATCASVATRTYSPHTWILMIDSNYGLSPTVTELIPALNAGLGRIPGLHSDEFGEYPQFSDLRAYALTWIYHLKREVGIAIYVCPVDSGSSRMWVLVGTNRNDPGFIQVRHGWLHDQMCRPDVRMFGAHYLVESTEMGDQQLVRIRAGAGSKAAEYVIELLVSHAASLRTEAELI